MKRRTLWRRARKAALVGALVWTWQAAALWAMIEAYGRVDRAQQADVIVVLGAGLRANNQPGPALTRRTERAAALWRAGYAPVVICSGGKPGNRTRSEADACGELLRAAGVPESAILLEDLSRSTEENALETGAIMDAKGWRTAILVSDGYHLLRAKHLFEQQGILSFPSPVPGEQIRPVEYVVFMAREIVAWNWLVVKEALGIPVTYVQGI